MAEEIKKGFATMGSESYNLSTAKKKRDDVVINIQQDKEGVVLSKEDGKKKRSDWYEKINRALAGFSKVRLQDKATFFHLLYVMLNAGVPMIKSLRSLAVQQERSPKLQVTLSSLAAAVEGGRSLSQSMLDFNDVFDEKEIGMVQSGEVSGQLSKVMSNIAKDAEKAYTIRHKIKSAMTYPIVVMLLLTAVVIGMLGYVVPQLTDLFAANAQELPVITKWVIAASDFLLNEKIKLLAIVGSLVAFFIFFRRTDTGKYMLDKIKISIPIFGELFKKAYLSRFMRLLSNLLDSNVSIVRTLEISANTVGNEVYRRRLLLAVEDIKQGMPLAENITESDLFPPMLVNMIDVGEKTAQLDAISDKVANFYEEEVDSAVQGIAKIIEPVVLIVVGLAVGIIVAAIMLPVMQLSNIAGVL